MSEVNATNSGGLDQPHVTPTDERDKGPQGFTPSIWQWLRDRSAQMYATSSVLLRAGHDYAAHRLVIEADEWGVIADIAERERWTREHDRTA